MVALSVGSLAGCGKGSKEQTVVVMPTTPATPKPKPADQPADGSAPAAPDAGAAPAAIPASTEPFDLVKLNETLKLFCRDQTRYPKDLTELVGPGFLTALPQVPAGKKLIMDKEKVEFRLVDK